MAAEAIRNEDPVTDNHVNRLIWARAVFTNPLDSANKMLMALLAANKDLTTTQIIGVLDPALQTAVDGAVNLFADGS